MEKEVFVKIINDTLKSFGFRKQGVRRWIRKGNDISLKVYLQKSQYGAFYYLRDYYVLNKMQVHFSNDKECPGDIVYSDENLLNMMCDLENDVPDSVRETSIKALLKEAFENHQYIETEEELKKMILSRLPCVFKAVMDYLGIDPETYNDMLEKERIAKLIQLLSRIFEAEPTGDYDIYNEKMNLYIKYSPESKDIQFRLNAFVNPYTQDVEKVYRQRLDCLNYFTEAGRNKRMQEVERIDADEPSKLGSMQVVLTVLEHCATEETLCQLRDVFFKMHSEQVPNETFIWFKSEYNNDVCYFEGDMWRYPRRAVIMGENGYERYDFSDKSKFCIGMWDIVTGDYNQLEYSDSFELISQTAFQEVWDKTEKDHEPEPWE